MNFVYGGKKSEDYGVVIGHTGGMENIPLIANESLVYDQTPNKYYHYGSTKELLEFNWIIVPVKGYWENGQLDRVVEWLNKDDFTKFTRDSWSNKVLYLKPTSMSLGGLSMHSSYIDITFTNISPYYYSDSSTELFNSRINLTNDGDYDIIAVIEVKSKGGDITITDGLNTVIIKDTIEGDVIKLDNHNGVIYSAKDKDIISKYNGVTLNLGVGEHNIIVEGGKESKITYQKQYDDIR